MNGYALIWVALITAVPPTMAVVLAYRAQQRDTRALRDAALIANQKIDHVTKLTNSGATLAQEKIETLSKEVASLREHIGSALPQGTTSQDVVPAPKKP